MSMTARYVGYRLAKPSRGRRLLVVLALFVVSGAMCEARPAAVVSREEAEGCPLFQESPTLLTPMTREEAVARMEALVRANKTVIERLDARWRAGEFGPPDSEAAERAVRRLARSELVNWYAFMEPLAQAEKVRVMDPATVEEISSRFSESTVFPTPRLHHLLVGRGWVCARYDLGGEKEEGETLLGGKRSRYELRDARVDGVRRPVLSVQWRSASVGNVKILFAEEYGFRLQRVQGEDSLGRYDLYLARDVAGAWVQRWGTHRPAGFAFWVAEPTAAEDEGGSFRVGAALYVPHLRLRLPLLPDIGFDDVRLLSPPVPLLAVEDVARGGLPSWLPTDELDLRGWSRMGDPPDALREAFPDL